MIQKFSRKELQRLGCSEEEIDLVMKYQKKFPIILDNEDNMEKFCIDAKKLWNELDCPQGQFNKWVERKFKRLLILAGYDENYCRVHDLRGQYVDIMKAIGISTSYISKEVGHSRTSTTDMYYTQILEEVYETATTKLDEKIFS